MVIIIDFAKAFRILASFFLLLLILAFTTTAYAAKVNRSKGKAVEIQLERDEDLVKGDTVYVISSKSGKKIGKITISKIKGKKAIGKLVQGKAPKNAAIQMPTAQASDEGEESDSSESAASGGFLPENWRMGAVLGFASNSQKLKSTGGELDMSGSSFTFKIMGDLPIMGDLGLIGRFGMDNFDVASTTSNLALCEGQANCDTKLMYLAGELLLRYQFPMGSFIPFIYGGLGFLYPLSKKTNALDEDRLGFESPFYFGAGFYYQVSSTIYIPLMVDVKMIMPDDVQNTMSINGSTGILMYF